MEDEQARGLEARLLNRIESEHEAIEHWKKELAIENDPEYRELFINNIRDEEAEIARCWKKVRELREKYNL
jgi:hypothetical protein